jgi:hypothetical protein
MQSMTTINPTATPGSAHGTQPVGASMPMSPTEQLMKSQVFETVLGNIMNNVTAGAKQAMDQMPKLGESDDDEPDPDGELGD